MLSPQAQAHDQRMAESHARFMAMAAEMKASMERTIEMIEAFLASHPTQIDRQG